MKKIIILFTIILLSSCGQKVEENEIGVKGENEIFFMGDFVDTELGSINCTNYSFETNIVECLQLKMEKVYTQEKKGKNSCKDLFNVSAYKDEYKPFIEDYYNQCSSIYNRGKSIENSSEVEKLIKKETQEEETIKEKSIKIKIFKNKKLLDINCTNYKAKNNLTICFEAKISKLDIYFEENNGKNVCPSIFRKNDYGQDFVDLTYIYYNKCNSEYSIYIKNNVKPDIKTGIDSCVKKEGEEYEMYDDETTGLTQYEQCRFSFALKDEKKCELFTDIGEKNKCIEIKNSIKKYEDTLIEKRYYEMFAR